MAAPHPDGAVERASQTQQRALLDLAVSQSSAIFYIVRLGRQRQIRFISSNVESITGHKPAAFLRDPKYGYMHIHPDDRLGFDRALEMLRKQSAFTQEYRFQGIDGDYLWFRDELRMITSDGSEQNEFVGCMIDVTAERLAARDLSEMEALKAAIVEAAQDAIVAIDSDGTVVEFNDQAEAMFGYGHAAAVGRRIGDLIVPKRLRAAHEAGLRRLRKTGASRVVNEVRRLDALRADGTEFPVEMTIAQTELHNRTIYVAQVRDISEKTAAEEEQRRLHQLLEDAVESLPNGFTLWDSDSRLALANTAFGRPYGLKPADLKGMSRKEVVRMTLPHVRTIDGRPVTDSDKAAATVAARLGQLGDQAMEVELANGGWKLITVVPTSEGGQVGVSADVTALKENEIALRDSEHYFRTLIEAHPLPVWLVEVESGEILYESPAAAELTGRTWQPGERHFVQEHYADPGQRGDFIRLLKDKGELHGLEFQFKKTDKSRIWVSVDVRLINFQGREVSIAVLTDLSERRAIEQALRESEQLVRQVLEACPVALTMNRIDDGVIIYESPAARTLLKYQEPQEGNSVIPRWDNPGDHQSYLERLRRDGAVDALEVHFRKADGEEFWCALSSRLIDYRGQAVVVSHLLDLTDRHAAEGELVRQREILHQNEKLSAMGELLAGVSHELNNPLSVLVGQSLMLGEMAPDDKVAARAEKIAKAADRCVRIVKSFLTMARQGSAELAPVDLTEVIESAVEVTAYSLRTSDIEVSFRMAKTLPTVMGDPDQLRQVFTNLIINAKNALEDLEGPRKLRITSFHRKQSDQVTIKVKDNGPGIPAEIRTRIFEPLYTTKKISSGIGIGLALCHRVIEAHGGSIVAERAPGEGAIFAIRLPRAEQAESPAAEIRRAMDTAAKCRVLVVDDEYDVGQIISDVLEHDGHSVDVAASGEVALQKIKRRRYDVVLSDIRMPGMDGPSFYRVLSDTKPEQVAGLAFITGDTLSPQVKDFLDTSERPYLEKPLMRRDIVELVDLLMRRKAS